MCNGDVVGANGILNHILMQRELREDAGYKIVCGIRFLFRPRRRNELTIINLR